MRRTTLLPVVATALLVGLHTPADAAGGSTGKPCAAFDATTRTDPVLGQGLSLTTPYPGNLVPAGQPARVDLVVTLPASGTLSYTVSRRSAVLLRDSVAVPASTTALTLPVAAPGAYQVEATLTTNGTTVGGSCLRYGVSMPGAALDLANLPAGRDWGGPAAEREVVLQQALAGQVVRRGVNFGTALATPGAYDDTFRAAAARAKAAGILFDVQVGQGGAAERAAIGTPAWENGVRALVARQKGVVPYWEAWNEPNFDYFFSGTAADYVNKVLKPFFTAVHDADPAAKVVGGSTYGTDPDWWKAFAKADGFRYLDVVAIHSYAWDTAWEKTTMVSELIKLKQLKAKHGAAAKPLWDTESGYRSLAEAGGPWAQADWATRKVLWERTLGIPTQSFLVEGGWEDWCVIDQYRGVKPAAMALSTLDTVLDGRAFVSMVKIATKNVYVARFGAATKGGDGVLAVWTDGRQVRVPLKTSHTGWDGTGGTISVATSFVAGGGVQYLTFAPGKHLL